MTELDRDLLGAVRQKLREDFLRVRLRQRRNEVPECFDGIGASSGSGVFIDNSKHEIEELVGQMMCDYVGA